ncbi:hypothetical protein EIN_083690 [Entamoeba invadens IP1]|uniref:hypothetical protein n=1 Tax=Entamoeba invadens IP1 TaxID=370355 RepID=UPI0002C3DFCC|nr:hypothetical protein EIN_083690 [Entamoeba invadens IP1]ELP85227.1 hypothetical protein EIN_083690 [Entamoeba invadens IP1]|eukprot:XP_004184573.1 hypothetical protein EIN_083690 [Entamoeba invadens IP1]
MANDPRTSVEIGCSCYLCANKERVISKKRIPWTTICKIVLVALENIEKKQFYSAHDDIYPFVTKHWAILGKLPQFSARNNWRKALLDSMNHCGSFESTTDKKRMGLWRLRSDESEKINSQKKLLEKKEKKTAKVETTTCKTTPKQIEKFSTGISIAKDEKYTSTESSISVDPQQKLTTMYQDLENVISHSFSLICLLDVGDNQKIHFNTSHQIISSVTKLSYLATQENDVAKSLPLPQTSYVAFRLL